MAEKIIPGPLQRKWLDSLRNNPQRQVGGRLGIKEGNGDYKVCCLGELGLITGECEFTDKGVLTEKRNFSTGALHCSYRFLGLNSPFGDAVKDDFSLRPLSVLNDSLMIWPEIADHVEENFEYYFTKSY